jgi:hypothetical protein
MTYAIAEPCIDITQALELSLLELAECMVVSGLAQKESRAPKRARTTTRTGTTRASSGTRSSRGRTERPDSTGSR